jgi:HSP20 family protein
MTKVIYANRKAPAIDRDTFLTPFDRMFDQVINTQFPEIEKQIGVKPYQGTAYPKVNVYEWDTKIGVIAEIPGLSKKDLSVEVTDGILTISGDKHKLFDVGDAKVVRKELKQSSFKRQFELGEELDGKNIKAKFEDGVLSIEIPKIAPETPKTNKVKIS